MIKMRLWSRYENNYPILTPVEKYTKQILYKNNILKHKSNELHMTKKQKYSYYSIQNTRRVINCPPKPEQEITLETPRNMVIYLSKNTNSYYPSVKRTMHVAGTNWPNGANSGVYPSACQPPQV